MSSRPGKGGSESKAAVTVSRGVSGAAVDAAAVFGSVFGSASGTLRDAQPSAPCTPSAIRMLAQLFRADGTSTLAPEHAIARPGGKSGALERDLTR